MSSKKFTVLLLFETEIVKIIFYLLGAGIFVTTVVAGSINIYDNFKMARRPFLRDNVFYMAAVVWTFIVMYKEDIKIAESIGMKI